MQVSHGIIEEEKKKGQKSKNVVLVVFIGGVTFAEISALRQITEKQEKIEQEKKNEGESDYKATRYVVLTTKLINGNTLLSSIYE
jgi:uncharacterized protein YegL